VPFIGSVGGVVLALLTFQPGDAIQLLGISSVAVGFAFRDILRNFLVGILRPSIATSSMPRARASQPRGLVFSTLPFVHVLLET